MVKTLPKYLFLFLLKAFFGEVNNLKQEEEIPVTVLRDQDEERRKVVLVIKCLHSLDVIAFLVLNSFTIKLQNYGHTVMHFHPREKQSFKTTLAKIRLSQDQIFFHKIVHKDLCEYTKNYDSSGGFLGFLWILRGLIINLE